jgi:hypothetical protein
MGRAWAPCLGGGCFCGERCRGRTRDRRGEEAGTGGPDLLDQVLGPTKAHARLASPSPPRPETSQSGGWDPAPHHHPFATQQSNQHTPRGEKKKKTAARPASSPPRPSPPSAPGAPAPGWGSEREPGAPHRRPRPPRCCPPARGGGGPTAPPPRPPGSAAPSPGASRSRARSPPGAPARRPRALHGCAGMGLVPARGAHRADQRHPSPEPSR